MNRAVIARMLVALTLPFLAGGCIWTVRVNVAANGAQAADTAFEPALSGDGRYVAFQSSATNLVPGGSTGYHIFVRDNTNGAVEIASVSSSEVPGNAKSYHPTISADGRYVAFVSHAWNLVAGDNPIPGVFVRDRVAGTTSFLARASEIHNIAFKPDMSATGRFVTWEAESANLINVFDRASNTLDYFIVGDFVPGRPSISDDGRFVAYTSRGSGPVFVYDRQTGTTETVPFPEAAPISPSASSPSISGDGRTVAYTYKRGYWFPRSSVFAYNRDTGTSTPVTVHSDGRIDETGSGCAVISADGRYVAFSADGLVPEDDDFHASVYVRDLVGARTHLVSTNAHGGTAEGQPDNNSGCDAVAISDDARYLAFATDAGNVVANDTNGTTDIFVRAFPKPDVQSASPSTLARGTTATVTVRGYDFVANPQVGMGSGISINSVTRVSSSELSVSVSVASNAPTGAHDVSVTNPGTGPGPAAVAVDICGGCITVT